MKRLFLLITIFLFVLVILPLMTAATNLNSSKSNCCFIVSDARLVTQAQGNSLAKELDKLGTYDEAKIKIWFANNFRTFGVDGSRIGLIKTSLQQSTRCDQSASCKGKWKGPSLNARSTGSTSCFCYEPINSPVQTQRLKGQTRVVIFLLADDKQENDAYEMAVNLNSSKSN